MKEKNTKPFFARFLEGMDNETLDLAKAGATMKWPSDDDEPTAKYPSDDDEIVTRKITDVDDIEEVVR